MAVARPTLEQMTDIVASLGMRLEPERIAEFTAQMGGSFAAYDAIEAALVLRSPGFAVLLLIGLVNASLRLWLADEAVYGVAVHPVTRWIVQGLRESFSLIPYVVAVVYAGELVWRDRERRVEDLVGATPAPDWSFAFPKMAAVAVVLLALTVVGALAGASTWPGTWRRRRWRPCSWPYWPCSCRRSRRTSSSAGC